MVLNDCIQLFFVHPSKCAVQSIAPREKSDAVRAFEPRVRFQACGFASYAL